MPTIGYCHDCGAWVTVNEEMACPNGHAAARVNGWYDEASGQPLEAGDSAHRAAAPVPVDVSRSAFLGDLMATFAANPAYTATWGDTTDMAIESNPVDARWGFGSKRVDYSAVLKAVEADRTVYFWELLKERTSGFAFGSADSGSFTQSGLGRSEQRTETVMGPGSVSWEWGYGTLRKLVEDVAARHGFTVRVVLTKHAASW